MLRLGIRLLLFAMFLLWPTVLYHAKHGLPWSKGMAAGVVLYIALEGTVLALVLRRMRPDGTREGSS